MATVQQFIVWLKKEKSKRGCMKMATPDSPTTQDSVLDDQYGMKSLLTRKDKVSPTTTTPLDTTCTTITTATPTTTNSQVIEQFCNAPCRASMKLPPIPREEGRRSWVPNPRRIHAESPAHIYEEIPWSAVETDYEEDTADNASANRKAKTDKNANTKTNNSGDCSTHNTKNACDFTKTGQTSVKQGCEPYMVVQLQGTSGTSSSPKQTSSDDAMFHKLLESCSKELFGSTDLDAADKQCTDPLLIEDGLEKYAANFMQCQKCNRPHGLFNGTQIKHFDEHDEVEGGNCSALDRLSVRVRNNGPVVSSGFRRGNFNSAKKFGPTVRTNPRVSERNFKFTRSSSLDNTQCHNNSQSQPGTDNTPVTESLTGHVAKVQESDSADTCNEYDIHTGSDMSNRSCSKSSSSSGNISQRSSIASDSAASNLYGSECSHDSLNSSHDNRSRRISRDGTKHNESDSSNDTFSEYDIKSSDSYSSTKGIGDEYDYYLNKIRQNLWFKHETLRVIRESESSDYETSEYQSSSLASSHCDDASLSQEFSDVSNCSAFNEPRTTKLKSILKTSSKSCTSLQNRPKRSLVIKDNSHVSKLKALTEKQPTGSHLPSRKKPNRRKSTGNIQNTLECYTLPEFSSESGSNIMPDGGVKNSNSSTDGSSLDGSTASISSISEAEALDRLSCRATNYKPAASSLVATPGDQKPLGGSSSAFTKVGAGKVTVPKMTPGVVSRAPSRNTHTQSRPQHNRLLTDIMKINHDRQLLFL